MCGKQGKTAASTDKRNTVIQKNEPGVPWENKRRLSDGTDPSGALSDSREIMHKKRAFVP